MWGRISTSFYGKLTKMKLKYKNIASMSYTFLQNLFISYEYVIKFKYMILNMPQSTTADYSHCQTEYLLYQS